MIYPSDFEDKIGFTPLRALLKENCAGRAGKKCVDAMKFSTNFKHISNSLRQTAEMLSALDNDDVPGADASGDVSSILAELKAAGSFVTPDRILNLRKFLICVADIRKFTCSTSAEDKFIYPAMADLFRDMLLFPELVAEIDAIVNKFGEIKETATPELYEVVKQIKSVSASMSTIVRRIFAQALKDGLVEKDSTPAMRDGRLVIPVPAANKRSLTGIVHDISATGKTAFIEPAEAVQAGNRLRELEMERHRIEVAIMIELANKIRPYIDEIAGSARLAALFDFITAKAKVARILDAQLPHLQRNPEFEWYGAVHPVLKMTLSAQGREVVPFNLRLDRKQRFLVISGPNAGGKSVTLKTTGIIQYMTQCGMLPTLRDNSHLGIIENIFIDIGDEQSIENDLSTYSSHLKNMKYFMRNATSSTLILIDEIGSGTEPQMGSALAQAVLAKLAPTNCFGVVTTHYHNIKTFADSQPGFINGAMLYDRQKFRPLFQLSIGHPGSSFAIEIARSIGLPSEVIEEAKNIVGSDYVNMDKYLLDIARDRRYWENKRLSIKEKEHKVEVALEAAEKMARELKENRSTLIRQARDEAKEIVSTANARIERTIHDIKRAQAEKEQTRKVRSELEDYKKQLDENESASALPKQLREIEKARRKKKTPDKQSPTAAIDSKKDLQPGDYVKMYDGGVTGRIISVDGKRAEVAFGTLRTIVDIAKLKPAQKPKQSSASQPFTLSKQTSEDSRKRQLNFNQEIDVRGMRADEALQAVTYFIDDAVQFSASRLRILHGTGTGALRVAIRQWLAANPAVADFHDEDVRFGGAGITIVELK